MKPWAAIVVLVAVAQAAKAAPCRVTFVRAPDDVRAIVGSLLRDETACGAALEVDVVATHDGLHLEARDAGDRIRSRDVHDARTAGALIASWTIDDRLAPPPALELTLPVAPVVPAPSEPVDAPLSSTARDYRTAMLGGTAGAERGVRLEADLIGGPVIVGVAVNARYGTLRTFGETRDLAVVGYVAGTREWSGWRARATAGIGGQLVGLRMHNTNGEVWASGTDSMVVVEASVSISHRITAAWSVTAGLVVAVLPQPTVAIDAMSVREDLPVVAPQALLGVARSL